MKVEGLQQEEYMRENYPGNKYFLMSLDTEVRKNGSVTKTWLCKVISEKWGQQVTKSPSLNPALAHASMTKKKLVIFLVTK